MLLAWPVLLWGTVLVAFAGIGFNPTDEGFVQAAAWRLLNGDTPHADLIWSRPMGSAYLHLPELLLPTPMVLTARAIVLAEVVAYSLLLAVLVLDRQPLRWSAVEAAGVGASVLVNLHAAPLLTWYTIDGLLLVATGAVLLRSGMRRHRVALVAAAFLALGLAATVKQSFWPAPILALAWLVAASPGRRPRRIGEAAVAVVAAALPVAGYGTVVGLGGGLDEMARQLTAGPWPLGAELFGALGRPAVLGSVIAGGAALAALALLPWSPVPRLIVQVLMAAVVIGIVADGRLLNGGTWAIVLWWLVVGLAAAALVATRRVDWTALALIGLGWMVSMSHGGGPGVAAPNLVGGSLALFLLHRGVELPLSRPRPRRVTVTAAAMVVLALVTLPLSVIARTDAVHRDRPLSELTTDLGSVLPDLSGVRGTHATADYLHQLSSCVANHPATRVAVLPDNAAIYPMLELRNPFPVDWARPLGLPGARSAERLVAAASEVDAAGDYLVLFQTVHAGLLRTYRWLEPGETIAFDDVALGERLYSTFRGEPVECGPFIGFWSPAPAR